MDDGLGVQANVAILCDILAIDEDQLLTFSDAQFVLNDHLDLRHADFGWQEHLGRSAGVMMQVGSDLALRGLLGIQPIRNQ